MEIVLDNTDAVRHALMLPGLNPMFTLEFTGPGLNSLRFVTPDEDVTLEFHCHVHTPLIIVVTVCIYGGGCKKRLLALGGGASIRTVTSTGPALKVTMSGCAHILQTPLWHAACTEPDMLGTCHSSVQP